MESHSPIIIEKIVDDEYIPIGFMSLWSGSPESIPEGWKLADLDWLKTKVIGDRQ